MEVTIRKAIIENVALQLIGGDVGLSADKDLELLLDIRATDPAKRFNYTTWTGTDKHVKDDLGNTYHHVIFTDGRPVGRTVNATVMSDNAVVDVLVIERPVPAAKYLDIDLPAPFDKSKAFRFRIKTSEIKRPK